MDDYSSTYFLYKRETKRFSEWLANTAIEHGYPVDRFSAQQHDTEQAKPEARGKKADQQRTSYVLRMAQFVEVARFLVENGYQAPTSVRELLNRCIRRRIKVLDFFAKQGGLEEHVFFVQVLIDTGHVLEANVQTPPAATEQPSSPAASRADKKKERKKADKKKQKQKQHGGNLFAQLGVEEVAEPDTAGQTARGAHLDFDVEDTEEEALYAFMAMYSDFYEALDVVRQTWREYKERKCDLIVAAMVSYSAADLLERTHDDVMAQYGYLFRTPGEIILRLTNFVLRLKTGLSFGEWLELNSVSKKTAPAQLAELLPPEVHATSERFLLVAYHTTNSIFEGQTWYLDYLSGKKPWPTSLPPKSARKKLKIPEPPKGQTDASTLDAMFRERNRCREKGRASLLLLFLSFLSQDTMFELGQDRLRAHKEAQRSIERMLRSIEEAGDFERELLGPAAVATSARKNIKSVVTALQSALLDLGPTVHGAKLMKKLHPDLLRRTQLEWMSIQHNAPFCGLVLFEAVVSYSHTMLHIINDSTAILSAAHLYNACQTQWDGVVEEKLSWPDMDLLIRLQGIEKVFGGRSGLPQNLTDCFRTALSTFGFPESEMTDLMRNPLYKGLHRQRKKLGRSNEVYVQHEQLSIATPAMTVFETGGDDEEHCCVKAQVRKPFHVNLDPTIIESLIRDPRNSEVRAILLMPGSVRSSGDPENGRGGGGSARGAARLYRLPGHRGKTVKDLSISGLLRVVKSSLKLDVKMLEFNYLALQTQCYPVLRRVFDENMPTEAGRVKLANVVMRFPKGVELMWFVCQLLYGSHATRQALGGASGKVAKKETKSGLLIHFGASFFRALRDDAGDLTQQCSRLGLLPDGEEGEGKTTQKGNEDIERVSHSDLEGKGKADGQMTDDGTIESEVASILAAMQAASTDDGLVKSMLADYARR